MDTPSFSRFVLRDVNPVSGRTKIRVIGNPNRAMREIHARFIEFLQGQGILMPSATACSSGQSAIKNVVRHRKNGRVTFNRYFVLLDIVSAYQAVTIERMTDALASFCREIALHREETKSFLQENFFDKDGGLVTGGPASPLLFNLYCEFHIDYDLREICARHKIVFTRYLDDLVFSSQVPIGRKKRQALRRVIESAGFKISDKKAETIDLRKGPTVLNGIGITLEGRVFLPRRTLEHIRALLFMALRKGTVKPATIHGKMGLLVSTLRYNPYVTSSEKGIVKMYREYLKKLAEAKTDQFV